jgi:hypothetical protein
MHILYDHFAIPDREGTMLINDPSCVVGKSEE